MRPCPCLPHGALGGVPDVPSTLPSTLPCPALTFRGALCLWGTYKPLKRVLTQDKNTHRMPQLLSDAINS